MRFWSYLFGTFFFSGRSPIAPGTAGSFAALLLYLLLAKLLPVDVFPVVLVLGIVLFIVLGIPAASYIANREKREDPGLIVIDEAAGQWLTFLFLPVPLVMAHLWIPLAGFLFFRFFDIAKVFPANLAEKLPGGLGIMADDVVAGLYACVLLNLIVKFTLL